MRVYSTDSLNLTTEFNKNISMQVLDEAGNALLYISSCFENPYPPGYFFLGNLTIDNERKQELIDTESAKIHDSYIYKILKNLSKIEEENKFYNWYHGYTRIFKGLPVWESDRQNYNIFTSATSGSIKTQYYGYQYDPEKIEKKLFYRVTLYAPFWIVGNPDYTLTLEIEKVSMRVPPDVMILQYGLSISKFDIENKLVVVNITKPSRTTILSFSREADSSQIGMNTFLGSIPGFNLKWNYNQYFDPETKFQDSVLNSQFRR